MGPLKSKGSTLTDHVVLSEDGALPVKATIEAFSLPPHIPLDISVLPRFAFQHCLPESEPPSKPVEKRLESRGTW